MKIDSTELKIDSNTESFQRVCALILHSAQEAGIDKMLTDPHFIPTTESAIPESATPENSRKYELMLKKYEQQRQAISDLRKEAAEYLSPEVHKELAIRMGKSATAILSAAEMHRGLRQHYCVLTEAKSNELAWAVQEKWREGKKLSTHIMTHAEARERQEPSRWPEDERSQRRAASRCCGSRWKL